MITDRMHEVIVAYLVHETNRAAAASMGIALSTFRNELSTAYGILGVRNIIGAAKAIGWLKAPPR